MFVKVTKMNKTQFLLTKRLQSSGGGGWGRVGETVKKTEKKSKKWGTRYNGSISF